MTPIQLSAIRNEDGTITDPSGKVWQVVPMEATAEMAAAWNSSDAADYKIPDKRYSEFLTDEELNTWSLKQANLDLRAMLAAARPQVKGVELPERLGNADPDDRWDRGWNACLDAITQGMKP